MTDPDGGGKRRDRGHPGRVRLDFNGDGYRGYATGDSNSVTVTY
ncbi:hypothetical protein ACIO93_32155 [Streptomyces sp. NPDC087903]